MRVECVNSPFVLLFTLIVVATTAVLAQTQMTSPTSSLSKEQGSNNHKGEGDGEGKNIVKYVLAAKYLHNPDSMLVIPSRPVRRLGSEFLGKRSDMPIHGGKARITKRRAMGSEFLGKRRAMGSEFLGKRGLGSQVEDYALSSMETSGWSRPEEGGYPLEGLEMMQKKNAELQRASDYIGNSRKFHEYPAWKQSLNSRLLQFDKKRRAMGSEFLGKRSSPMAMADE